MRKILFLLIAIIISGNITAQKLDWQERRKAADNIDVLIQNYINLCELSELGKSEYSTTQVEAFKTLFADDADIIDRIASKAAEDGGSEVTEQSADEYTQALMARYPRGMTIKISKLQADYNQLDQRKARVLMERQFRARKEVGGYALDTADVMLHLTLDEDLDIVKISKFNTELQRIPPPPEPEPVATADAPIARADIMKINLKRNEKNTQLDLSKNDENIENATYKRKTDPERGTLKLTKAGRATYTPLNAKTIVKNDQFEYEVCDSDNQCSTAIVNVEIKTKRKGEVDDKRDYAGLHITPIVAFGLSSNDGNIAWGYETVRNNLTGEINSNSGTNLGGGLELDYYFTDNIGIGAGVQYNQVSGGFGIQNFNVSYADTDDRDYERIITINDATEDYTMTNIGVPALLKFRTHPRKKLGVFAHAGILYNLSSMATSSMSGTGNFEAIRYSTNNGETEDSYSSSTMVGEQVEHNWNQTIDGYELHGAAGVDEHLNQLCNDGFNLGRNVPFVGDDSATDIGAHLNLLGRIGLSYHFSPNTAIQIGAQYTSGTLTADDNYQIANEITCDETSTHAEYNTLLKGGSTYSTFGLNLGLSIRLSGKK